MLIDQLEDPENEHSIDYGKLLGPELRFYTAKKVRSFSPPHIGAGLPVSSRMVPRAQVTKVLSEAVVKDMGKYYLQRRIELLLKGKITDRYLRKLTKSPSRTRLCGAVCVRVT